MPCPIRAFRSHQPGARWVETRLRRYGKMPESTQIKYTLSRVLDRADSLRQLQVETLRPALRYKALVGMLRAVRGVGQRLEEDAAYRGEAPATPGSALAKTRAEAAEAAAKVRAASQADNVALAAAVFDWVDRGGKGVVTVDDLMAAVEAVAAGDALTEATGLPSSPTELETAFKDALGTAGEGGEMALPAFTNMMLLHMAHEKAKLLPLAETGAAFIALGGGRKEIPTARAAETIVEMAAVLPYGERSSLAAEACEPSTVEAALTIFDYEERQCLHFDSFTRLVARAWPTPW